MPQPKPITALSERLGQFNDYDIDYLPDVAYQSCKGWGDDRDGTNS